MNALILAADNVNVAQNVGFGVIAFFMIFAALAVVTTNNVVHAALWLVIVLGGVARVTREAVHTDGERARATHTHTAAGARRPWSRRNGLQQSHANAACCAGAMRGRGLSLDL